MVELSIITDFAANHPQELLIWTNGFFCALALRRGRVEALFNKVLPISETEEGAGEK